MDPKTQPITRTVDPYDRYTLTGRDMMGQRQYGIRCVESEVTVWANRLGDTGLDMCMDLLTAYRALHNFSKALTGAAQHQERRTLGEQVDATG